MSLRPRHMKWNKTYRDLGWGSDKPRLRAGDLWAAPLPSRAGEAAAAAGRLHAQRRVGQLETQPQGPADQGQVEKVGHFSAKTQKLHFLMMV